ncbi:MAG: archaeal proteasome endopeptidase complex subunit alpha [Candidatus Aenigmarchaeota archaeon]|nr:archaeal proteasome endopeptidase complex subunit alpha [Candidatus Aenigmarchaeota archaeon]
MADMDLPSQMGYDRAIVVFSPEGRIYQVEYALQAVKLGKTCVGVVFKDGIVLAAYTPDTKLQLKGKATKVAAIDKHMGATACGFTGDARALIDILRVHAQIHKMTFGEPIDVFVLGKKIADRMQLYTQFAGARPYGVAILLGGVNEESILYVINPSGTLDRWLAKALGRGEEDAQKYLESNYKDDMTEEQAKKLVVSSIEAGEKKFGQFDKKSIEMMVIRRGEPIHY